MSKRIVVRVLAILAVGSAAIAAPPDRTCERRLSVTFGETFSGGSNEGAWTFNGLGQPFGRGGRPGAFLRAPFLDTFAPQAQTAPGLASRFTGDYRARNVTGLAADFKMFRAQTTAERPLTMMLFNDNGTPEDPTDDLIVYFVGERNIPDPGINARNGWVRYEFPIPSQSPTLPEPRSLVEGQPGWVARENGDVFTEPADPDAIWNAVIRDVDQVVYWFHDPRFFAIFQVWDVGLDNPSITTCEDPI